MSADATLLARHRAGPGAARLAEMLRVDHAGEFGAVQIYRGQRAIFDKAPARAAAAETIAAMEAGEAAHLETFNRLLAERKVRPTLLGPIWSAAGFGLGAVSALIGEKTAMAVTEAVEDVIERHYAAQAAELAPSDPALADTLARFREDELGHKREAEAQGAADAPGYAVLKAIVGAGCRLAIRLSEKI